MSDHSAHYSISLTPVFSQNTLADCPTDNENSWLDNSSASIFNEGNNLPETSDDSIVTVINTITEQSSDDENKYVTTADFNVDKFEIKTTPAGVFLITRLGEQLLQDKQAVAINNTLFQLNITQINAIQNQTPINQLAENNGYNPFSTQSSDIWQDGNSHLKLPGNIPSSLFDHNNQYGKQEPVQTDPLNFLYQSPAQAKSLNNAALHSGLPYTEQTEQFVHTNQLNQYSQAQETNHSGDNYKDFLNRPAENNIHFDQGDVLNDLGINKQASSIVSQEISSNAATYSDSSPMDMLDSFLEAPSPLNIHNSMQPVNYQRYQPLPYQTSPSYRTGKLLEKTPIASTAIAHSNYKPINKSSILGGLKNVFKKISI